MRPEIKIIRRTLPEVYQQAKLGPKNELLMYVFIFDFHLYIFYDTRYLYCNLWKSMLT